MPRGSARAKLASMAYWPSHKVLLTIKESDASKRKPMASSAVEDAATPKRAKQRVTSDPTRSQRLCQPQTGRALQAPTKALPAHGR